MPAKPDLRWLARPCKRHYTFAAAAPIDQRPGIRHGAIASFNALICRVYLLRETALPGPGRSGQGLIFAPFVYRLGRHPFTVERAVRFR